MAKGTQQRSKVDVREKAAISKVQVRINERDEIVC